MTWQTIATYLIGAAAAMYLGRWILMRVRTFMAGATGRGASGSGMCSSCRCGTTKACESTPVEPHAKL